MYPIRTSRCRHQNSTKCQQNSPLQHGTKTQNGINIKTALLWKLSQLYRTRVTSVTVVVFPPTKSYPLSATTTHTAPELCNSGRDGCLITLQSAAGEVCAQCSRWRRTNNQSVPEPRDISWPTATKLFESTISSPLLRLTDFFCNN